MTDLELNKRLHEILNLCWHESLKDSEQCSKFLSGYRCDNIDFLAWEGFGVLWKWLQKHEKREKFFFILHKGRRPTDMIYIHLINPRALAEAVVEFFKETE